MKGGIGLRRKKALLIATNLKLLSVVSIRRKLLKTTHTEERLFFAVSLSPLSLFVNTPFKDATDLDLLTENSHRFTHHGLCFICD